MQKRSRLATHTSPNEELLLLRDVHESTLAELAGLRAQSQKHKDDAARLQAQVDALAGALRDISSMTYDSWTNGAVAKEISDSALATTGR